MGSSDLEKCIADSSGNIANVAVERLQALVHAAIHFSIKPFVDVHVLRLRLKNAADACHLANGGSEVRMQPQPDRGEYRRTHAARFEQMWTFARQIENVGGDL